MKCKHPAKYRLDMRWGPVVRDGHEVPSCQTPIRVNICGVCLHWLPLGPANDSDEQVMVEKRAAELNVPGYSCADDHAMEWAGRRHYIEGHEFPTSLGGQCGWLAQVINDHTTHAQEQEG